MRRRSVTQIVDSWPAMPHGWRPMVNWAAAGWPDGGGFAVSTASGADVAEVATDGDPRSEPGRKLAEDAGLPELQAPSANTLTTMTPSHQRGGRAGPKTVRAVITTKTDDRPPM
ncbi:MAG: hypothetical protein OEW24_00060 [Chloroflexota bacterium]|nr:hypothetical protein [Chloroflexota bacterium]